MSMLPRLRPEKFYDLVIEVAIVRPGPIQGNMVHPYLRRRQGIDTVSYPSKALEQVLGKTLGVPLFQEQAMKIAMVAAGFTATEADGLRRAMATFKRTGTIHTFGVRMIEGMKANGYDADFAERCFRQIEGFGEYGFPESHAASFARLVYVSAWMKRRYPAVFACALLNSQPMGFYAPAQIVRDASDHGVEVRPADVNHSDWDCTLEPRPPGGRVALRLGLRQISGFAEAEAAKLVAARGEGYASPRELWRRADLKAASLRKLAEADAWRSVGLDRRQALWALKGLGEAPPPLLAAADRHEPAVALPEMPLGEHVVEDYRALKLSLKAHPVSFLRESLAREGVVQADRLPQVRPGAVVTVAGLVLVRQRPATASGIIFITLEDETGVANLIVRPELFEASRKTVLGGRLIAARGKLEREGLVIHVLARSLTDLTDRLDALGELPSPHGRGDHVKHQGRDPRDAMPRGRNFR
jgi:error-prone DNA polymerase